MLKGTAAMKTLFLLRHAKSSWDDPTLEDHERPCSKRGKRDAAIMGHLIRQEHLIPDVILTSPARRAATTTEWVAEMCGYQGPCEMCGELYPGDEEQGFMLLQNVEPRHSRVLVVGHNPFMEHLLTVLTGQTQRLPTAALAQLALPIQQWRELGAGTKGDLVRVWRPKELLKFYKKERGKR